jgi:four helix bundle protein
MQKVTSRQPKKSFTRTKYTRKDGDDVVINNFRDLRVWQVAMDLIENIYLITQNFPPSETYGLSSQMRRAAVSIASNIAEGHAREYTKEYLHHISIAHGSLAELQTQVEVAARLRYVQMDQIQDTADQMLLLSKQLHALRNSLQRRSM